ncbi:MAG: YlxM family DNA-binding protein [Oscillospiraceae bacterium]|nr:YlxM family DNA-binding protein [Oscillospiraceae bacterium]
MKQDTVEMTLLYDFYGELLTEKQKLFFDLYYNGDYSLAEIAEEQQISRQGVHDAIARAEQTLRTIEEQVGAVQRHRTVQAALEELSARIAELEKLPQKEVQDAAENMQRILDTIKE